MTFYRKETLESGLRILTEEIPYVRSVSVGVWVSSGSRFERPELNGVSHFIEHLLFKGTKNRSAKAIAETIDGLGGQLNAFTSKEHTCYFVKVLDEHFSVALDVLADMLQNSLLQPTDIDKERGVIVEEIKMYEDVPDDLVHDLFAQTVWATHPLGKAIVGTAEVISGLHRNHIADYLSSHYTADRIVIAAAGNIRHQEAVETIVQAFSGLRGTAGERYGLEAPRMDRGINIRRKDIEQVHLCIGGKGVPQDHDDAYPLHVLSTILGGGSSSRLFQEIREERGLAYSVFSYQSSFRDAGLFTVYAGMSPAYLGQVIELILAEMSRIVESGVTEEEVIRAKEQMKGQLVLSLESTSNRMSRLGRSELSLGKILSPDQVIEKIDGVSRDGVHRLARELLVPGTLSLSAVGPVAPEFNPGVYGFCNPDGGVS